MQNKLTAYFPEDKNTYMCFCFVGADTKPAHYNITHNENQNKTIPRAAANRPGDKGGSL